MEVLPIETPALGDRSYLVHDGEAALVIDPQRDTDRVAALAADADVRITHVAETRVHNDYVTGGFALARRPARPYLINADDPVAFDRTPVSDGDAVEVGGMRVRVLATPAHLHPSGLRGGGRWRRGRGLHRRVIAVRLDRPDRPARPGRDGGAQPRPVGLGAPARP